MMGKMLKLGIGFWMISNYLHCILNGNDSTYMMSSLLSNQQNPNFYDKKQTKTFGIFLGYLYTHTIIWDFES